MTVFEYFGRSKSPNSLQKDNTLSVADLLNMFKKAKILDTNKISTPDFINIVEKYHANGQGIKLSDKLSDASFKQYCKDNADMFKINQEVTKTIAHNAQIEETKRFGQDTELEERELPSEEEIKEKLDAE